MKKATTGSGLVLAISAGLIVIAGTTGCAPTRTSPDAELRARVESVLRNASDLPANSLSVEVSDGIVTVSGSVVCDDCGGSRTPGGAGTIQQSLGAVVRAVPGVERVEFELTYR